MGSTALWEVQIAGWPWFGSVRLRFGMERFERFRFSVPVVPLRTGFLCVSAQFHREDGSGSGFGSWKTVSAVPVPRSVPAKTVPRFRFPIPIRFLGHPEIP